jgi:hypothetical protein
MNLSITAPDKRCYECNERKPLPEFHKSKSHGGYSPLKAKVASGLHVPWNLQVIPASKNIAKHNKFEAEEI